MSSAGASCTGSTGARSQLLHRTASFMLAVRRFRRLDHGERPFKLVLQSLALKRSVELLMQFAQALHRSQQNVIIQVVRDDASLEAVQDFLQLAQDLEGREVDD